MNRRRKEKAFILVAILLGVISMSMGFAAFSKSLLINSKASVTPESGTFTIKFVNPTNSSSTSITPTTTGGATADNATISGTTLSDISVNFTKPGQSATYTVNIKNDSPYIAYFTSVIMNSFGTCTAGTGATNSLVQNACSGIKLVLNFPEDNQEITGDYTDFWMFPLSIAKNGGYKKAEVKIIYSSTGARADGPFTVSFNPITINLSTVPPSSY